VPGTEGCGGLNPAIRRALGKAAGVLLTLHTKGMGGIMGKALMLWWLGVPGVIVLLLYLFVF
jgi:hypothetical protein